MMTHEEANELLAVFALDAVDPDEYEQIEEHLAECPRCRAEVDAHREVAAALGNSVEALPEGLWSGIASRLPARPDEEPPPMPLLVREESQTANAPGRPFRVARPARAARSPRGRLAIVGALAAAAAAAAVVLGVNLVQDNHQISHLQGAVGASSHSAVAAALATSGHKVVDLESADHKKLAEFVVLPDGEGYLVSSNLPTLSAKDTYQLWGVIGGRPISLGLLGRSPNQATFTSAGSRSPTLLALTVEPAGGSARPSSPMLATGTV